MTTSIPAIRMSLQAELLALHYLMVLAFERDSSHRCTLDHLFEAVASVLGAESHAGPLAHRVRGVCRHCIPIKPEN